ncbi:hypothetical protein TgHK011_002264 [Trichoderma gracile]|nr:hypothetical protein TgHK011_002264 [Trichoderma gracile]
MGFVSSSLGLSLQHLTGTCTEASSAYTIARHSHGDNYLQHLGPISRGDDACMDALAAVSAVSNGPREQPAMHPELRKDGEQQLAAAGTGTLPCLDVDVVAPVRCSRPGGLQALSVASGGAPRDAPGDRAAARIGPSAACRSPNVMQPKGDFVASTRHGPAETCNLHLLESLPHSALDCNGLSDRQGLRLCLFSPKKYNSSTKYSLSYPHRLRRRPRDSPGGQEKQRRRALAKFDSLPAAPGISWLRSAPDVERILVRGGLCGCLSACDTRRELGGLIQLPRSIQRQTGPLLPPTAFARPIPIVLLCIFCDSIIVHLLQGDFSLSSSLSLFISAGLHQLRAQLLSPARRRLLSLTIHDQQPPLACVSFVSCFNRSSRTAPETHRVLTF